MAMQSDLATAEESSSTSRPDKRFVARRDLRQGLVIAKQFTERSCEWASHRLHVPGVHPVSGDDTNVVAAEAEEHVEGTRLTSD
jgi:hypothetical protein